LEKLDAPVLGVVVNDVRQRRIGHDYGYGYGYGIGDGTLESTSPPTTSRENEPAATSMPAHD
jgi:hypothetical protein